ncbi:CRISPR-associated endoribonuclease Cas6 [Vulcanisaeta thermophila]|uniref:CRISPR-associated endoribonuclease Cas6 n=1 Tax=Vulcanisaeta thermophila TaxID=867917 RepID=UPI000853BAB0|nr:CRISPR-associated endoribonuclease Cas6 [Vulcanisaeta thermophila]
MPLFIFNLELKPKTALPLTGFTGYIAESLTLNIIGTVDKELAKKLHDTKTPKPFSVTPIIIDGKPIIMGDHVVEPGKALTIRVTAINNMGPILAEALDKVGTVRIGNVETTVEVKEALIITEEKLREDRGSRIRINFLTPVRFARKPLMRRRKPMFDFCPTPVNLARSALIHMQMTMKTTPTKTPTKLLRWIFTYVYMRDMIGRVVAVKHKNKPQLGFLGSAEYEINSARRVRREQFWTLLNYAELMNVGTGRSAGFGLIKITTP